MTVQVHDVAARFLHEIRRLEKAAIIVVRHEADFHALLLVGGLEIAVPRHFARVALGLVAQRKNRTRKLVLPKREKKITLILPQIASALEQMTRIVGAFFHACKMAGRNEIRTKLVRT